MLSGRIPGSSAPNAWSRLLNELRAEGAQLLDLTEANPTRVGLGGAGAAEIAALAGPGAERYEPDPRGALNAREAVSAYYRERGLAAHPDAIVLTAGTSESYAHLAIRCSSRWPRSKACVCVRIASHGMAPGTWISAR
jgi:aspartate/methionine/tyrosine aminotransferase